MQTPLVIGVLAACLSLSGCNSPGRYRPVQSASEWVSLSAGILDRNNGGADVLDDTSAIMLQGGYAFSRGRLRPSVELGFGVSRHDVAPVPVEGADRVDLYRALGGMRLEYDLESSPVTIWTQAGIYYRWTNETGFEVAPFDQDSDGFYGGAGFFLWWDRDSAIGPFITHFEGREDDNSETYFGFQVVLRHSGSIASRRSSY
ncbi:MAG: hypothetical protein ACI87A_001304 [Planctomycetota bacterium]|jgi:hypothetical protein